MIPHGEFEFNDPGLLRKKAEEKLIQKKVEKNSPTDEVDIKKLLHELQVHQIELEMQNEELELAYEITEATRKRLTMLYDLAPIGFFTLNENAGITELNFTGAEMLGEPRFSLIGSNFRLFLAQDSLVEFNNFFEQLQLRKSKESCRLNLGYDQKEVRSIYIEGIYSEEYKTSLLSVVDVLKFSE